VRASAMSGRIVGRTVSLIVDEVFFRPGNALDYCKLDERHTELCVTTGGD